MAVDAQNPLRIGILSFAHMHAYSYAAALAAHPGAKLVGIADTDAARGQSAAAQFETRFFDGYDSLLAQKLDGVIVTSENVHHRSLTELAASSGVSAILCEKPLATTLDDAQAMIAACSAQGVSLATAFPCRYAPAARRLRDQVRSGALGEVLAVRGTNRGRMPGGWFVDKALSGGGAVMDHSVHVADLNWWIFDREATEVYAEIGNGFYHQEFDDTGFLTINYAGGLFATLDTSWSRPASYPIWGDVTLQVVGTGGVIDVDLFAQNLTRYPQSASKPANFVGWGSDADAGLINEFLKLAAGEPAPDLATGDDGLRALRVPLAAYRSAELAQPITIES